MPPAAEHAACRGMPPLTWPPPAPNGVSGATTAASHSSPAAQTHTGHGRSLAGRAEVRCKLCRSASSCPVVSAAITGLRHVLSPSPLQRGRPAGLARQREAVAGGQGRSSAAGANTSRAARRHARLAARRRAGQPTVAGAPPPPPLQLPPVWSHSRTPVPPPVNCSAMRHKAKPLMTAAPSSRMCSSQSRRACRWPCCAA